MSFLVPLTAFFKQILEGKTFYFVKLPSSGVTFKLHRQLYFCSHGGQKCFGNNALPLETGLFSPIISNVCEFTLVSNDCLVSPT